MARQDYGMQENPFVRPLEDENRVPYYPLVSRKGIKYNFAVVFLLVMFVSFGICLLITAIKIPSDKKRESTVNSKNDLITSLQTENQLLHAELDEVTDVAYYGNRAKELGMILPDQNGIIDLEALPARP